MHVVQGKIARNLLLEEDTEIRGMVIGNVSVAKGVSLKLTGMVNGHINCRPGSEVVINGTVNGDVTNEGGSLQIYGTINGTVDGFRGLTQVDVGAHINDRQV